MKSCSRCRKRNTCRKLCPEVEARIPGEYSGPNPSREVCMPPESLRVAVDVHSYCLWVRGDSVAIPYTVGEDITGWTVYFAAKANPSDDNYAIGPIDVTAGVTDASTGSGLVNLDTTDTAILPRRYSAELEIRNGQSTNTPLRFRLWVDPDVIR